MSTLLVLGGSGRTGIHVLNHAAARGHQVRALVRNPDAVQAPPDVQLIAGTPASIDDIRRAARGAEAVISVLNNSRASDNPWAKPISPPSFMTDAARSTFAVMEEQRIARYLAVSTQGVAEDWKRLNPMMRGLINNSNIKAGYDDHNGVDALARASTVDWTLVRPVALTNKPRKGPLRAALPGSEKPGMFVNRDDLAAFILDTIEQNTWIRQTPVVWNDRA